VATLRKRYGIVETSVLREPWPREVKLTHELLLLTFVDRWALDKLSPEQATRATLSPGELLTITGAADQAGQVSALRELATFVTIKIKPHRNGFVEVHWPKLAKTQRWDAPKPGESRAPSGRDSGRDSPKTEPGTRPLSDSDSFSDSDSPPSETPEVTCDLPSPTESGNGIGALAPSEPEPKKPRGRTRARTGGPEMPKMSDAGRVNGTRHIGALVAGALREIAAAPGDRN
jgi:hypothetical protein